MATALDIVTRAYRKAGIGGMGETISAEMSAEGIDALNAMIHGWKLQGVDTTHTDIAITDTFPLASEYEEGTVYLLASRLSPDFMVPASFDADAWFRTFQAANMTIASVNMSSGLLNLPGSHAGAKRARL